MILLICQTRSPLINPRMSSIIPERGLQRLALQLLAALTSFTLLTFSDALLEQPDTGCWNGDQACLIHATLHRLDEPAGSAGLTIDIHCQLPNATSAAERAQDEVQGARVLATYLLRRLEHVKRIRLDGCHTPLSAHIYGLEYLPNCDSVPEVIVERFHADVLQPLSCAAVNDSGSGGGMQLEVLRYRHNELATIGVDAFDNVPQLRELYFAGNSLRHIARTAFDALRMVERIQLEREKLLALKEGDLFERSSVSDLQLIELKRVTAQFFDHLPETLRQLHVAHTTFDSDGIVVRNPHLLRNISIIDCALKTFVLHESAPTTSVRHINVSGNALAAFRVEFSDGSNTSISAVETLDLSANRLVELPRDWLHALSKLRWLSLRENHLKTLSLAPLLDVLPSVKLIDARNNNLTYLREATSTPASVSAPAYWDHTRLQIDGNPWNCMWLLAFAHTHPEKFRIFQYDKYISHINVNGLTCIPAEAQVTLDDAQTINAATAAPDHAVLQPSQEHNKSSFNASTSFTIIYGGPWDYKRSQRAEALIIVFMLPLGVALLFIILYMWINCQKIFHLSYYRTCPWSQRNIGRFRSAERFDVVRQLPPTATSTLATAVNGSTTSNNNDGYETPLSGVGSICNCNNIASSPYSNEKCRKLHHITYVELPSEQPYKIYEEIIGEDEETVLDTDTDIYAQPFYDHLSYSQTRSDTNESI